MIFWQTLFFSLPLPLDWQNKYGNRRFDETETTTIAGCERAICNPMVNPLNNRFMDGQGYEYDEAGNLTRDAQGRRFVYDGENKQVEVKDASICWKILL